jgi:hypothetical protein
VQLSRLPAPVYAADDNLCSSCRRRPVYIGTMCYHCWRVAQNPGRNRERNMIKEIPAALRLPGYCKCCGCVKRYCYCRCCCG